MVQCLYKKFTIRKGVQYDESEFVKMMKTVGKLALKTIITNNPFLKKKEVFRIAGNLAFEYGFFAGHENVRLCTDPVADISVTYAHRSLEEFFGSFGFLQALNDGKSVADILGSDCEKPIFMVNPLVLIFCLWFLSKEYFKFSEKIYDKLTSFVAKRIDRYTLDLDNIEDIFPAISIRNSKHDNNELLLKFFGCVFKKCVKIRVLYVPIKASMFSDNSNGRNEVNTILGRLSPNILDKLTVLTITDYMPHDVNIDLRPNFNIVISTHNTHDSLEILKLLLTKYKLRKRNPRVYLRIKDSFIDFHEDLTPLMTKHVKEMRLDVRGIYPRFTLIASSDFPFCPHFTHFTADSYDIDDSVPAAFMKAVKEGKLPNLRRIELDHCTVNDCEWPEVAEFSLRPNTRFDASKIQKLVSNLTELVLDSFDSSGDVDYRISTHLTKLTILKITSHNLLQLNDVLSVGRLPNLSALSVRVSTTLDEFLDEFDLQQARKLENLSLQSFNISSRKLKLLCQKLPYLQLRELNLSNSNSITGRLSFLFIHGFPRLNTLKVKSCYLISKDLRALCQANLKGKLPQLRYLDIIRSWPHLQKLQLGLLGHQISEIVDAVKQGLFPALETFRYSGHAISASDLFKLYKANISVEKYY